MRYFFVFFIFSVLSFAQFTINGELQGVDTSLVLVKGFKGASAEVLAQSKVRKNGQFTVKVPVDYKGKLLLQSLEGWNLDMLANNEDINFRVDLSNRTVQGLTFDDNLNRSNQLYLKEKEVFKLKDEVFPFLKSKYDASQDFYKSIDKETKRIETLEKELMADLDPMIKSFVDLQSMVSDSKVNPNLDLVKNKLLSGDNLLFSGGFFNELLLNYLQGVAKSATSSDDLTKLLGTEISSLIDSAGVESVTGQSILASALRLLPKEQFSQLNIDLLAMAEKLGSKRSSELNTIFDQSNIIVGRQAPNFSFTMQKKATSLYDVKAKRKLLVFWASWCPPCQRELPFIKEFYKDFSNNGGEIIAVSLDFKEEDYKNAIKDFGWINHSDLMKWEGPTSKLFGVNSTPTLMMLDENNVILKIGNNIAEVSE